MTADYELAVQRHRFDLLLSNGHLAALIETIDDGEQLLIENLAVAPDFQRQGFGRFLLAHVEQLARRLGKSSVRLYTNQRFVENVRLYERVGYQIDREEDYGVGIAIHMSKAVHPKDLLASESWVESRQASGHKSSMRHPRSSPPAVVIRQEDPVQPDVVELLHHGEAFSASLYPPESNHHLPLDSLREPEVRFLVARDAEGNALATGAVVLHDGWAEIKRMWVEEAARGRGIARQILEALIAAADRAGVEMLRLETGVASHAALALYEKTGFKRCEPFANYRPDPLSVFMERSL
jgi:putative acetyltransferase